MNAVELIKRVREKKGVVKPPIVLAMASLMEELLRNQQAWGKALESATKKHPKLPIA